MAGSDEGSPTSRKLAHLSAKRAGFTLMEMLVVLAIIALVAGVSTQLVRPASPKLRVEAAARALCSAARATRVRAIATNQEMSLFVDVAHRSFRSPVAAEVTLPNEARVDLTVAGGQRQGREGGAIVFFPTGGSTGGDVSIDLAGAHAHVGVNWLTGATTCDLG
jgi:general secretion pathway protein H